MRGVSSNTMAEMIDSGKLATVSMWLEKLDAEEALRLVCDTFTWEELWEGAAELNQLSASRNMDKKIPFVASSEQLFHAPGALKSTVKAEPAITPRLASIEKFMGHMSKAMAELKAARSDNFLYKLTELRFQQWQEAAKAR